MYEIDLLCVVCVIAVAENVPRMEGKVRPSRHRVSSPRVRHFQARGRKETEEKIK
jgi:hypothetical protein